MAGKEKYRGHLELANGITVELVGGDNAEIVKDTVQATLKGGCRFELAQTPKVDAQLVYHPSFEGGRKILGWIATGVIEPMTNLEFIDTFRLDVAA
jgi:hypothetical protein